MTPTFERIRDKLVPEFLARLESKNKDYSSNGVENHTVLGPAGQFADIWRKVAKLRKALWYGEPLEHEPVEEVILDMIGHLFLALDMVMNGDRSRPYTGGVKFVDKDACPSCGHSLKVSHGENGCNRLVQATRAGRSPECPCGVRA